MFFRFCKGVETTPAPEEDPTTKKQPEAGGLNFRYVMRQNQPLDCVDTNPDCSNIIELCESDVRLERLIKYLICLE
jgi:hypothetical protein